ncbi:hypothetical protein [Janthinobacterium sp. SUN137]|uniref:phosphorylase family protein n=1 Tax=Janthinobacterium sp. SUN137 TaxID=3014789 RepID=UPI0027144625|nr:hypothetical protein [Janthinobacterium sp. SUN137]MDO8040376.1 hypothetical protein [Janthinobacterium sp. SUN137]
MLLEDDPSKKGKLLEFLQSSTSLFSTIDVTLCTDDAERFLVREKYDLFIVDIIVPKNLSGERHERNSIALLEKLDEGATSANIPPYIVALSSASDLSQYALEYFVGRPWGILPYNENDDSAIHSIGKIASFIQSRNTSSKTASCDALVITALMDPEFSAVESLPFSWEPFEPLDAQHFMRKGSFENNGSIFNVIAVVCTRMGPVQAAILTTKCLMSMRPKIVVMAGICAGLPTRTDIGDVVAADVSWDWQSGKYVDSKGAETFQITPHQLSISDALRGQLTLLKKDSAFWQSLATLSSKHSLPIPKLVIGPMATGSSVLADERVTERIKTGQHKNLTGLDMETYGVYAAVQSCLPEIPMISLKAVCDKGDTQKSDEHQQYAADISARASFHFLMNYFKTV